MKVEYKISSIYETATEKTYTGKFNFIEITDIEITEENKIEFAGLEIGEIFKLIKRQKIQEFIFRFSIDKNETEISDFLKQVGGIFGEVINE
jgi:hypothetical protein